jgi:hypothetical protein
MNGYDAAAHRAARAALAHREAIKASRVAGNIVFDAYITSANTKTPENEDAYQEALRVSRKAARAHLVAEEAYDLAEAEYAAIRMRSGD